MNWRHCFSLKAKNYIHQLTRVRRWGVSIYILESTIATDVHQIENEIQNRQYGIFSFEMFIFQYITPHHTKTKKRTLLFGWKIFDSSRFLVVYLKQGCIGIKKADVSVWEVIKSERRLYEKIT